ncbi:secretion protein [Mycobacterium holsaticum DSM 44478]|nr:secretion protein [Mycolicibacterium holsaticum DSM 44478 = JCM 12374]QZA13412.1 CAP domain-containing protein [Mycolicibacterium holsaticum DSM 44478 = JCM 12374]UNC09122.1 CAP domain-containing protein [Mycolicibacterium holsaticum DSM 44478 = JCM 12374]
MIRRSFWTPPAYAAAVIVFVSTLAAAPAQAGGDEGGAVLNLINATRAANGCGPLAPNPQLAAAAARHANDVLVNGAEGHVGSDGSSISQRVKDAGYAANATIGEVVFWGTGAARNPAAAVTWWMNSPGHRAIITDCGYTEAGFSAVSNGRKMSAAGDFGKR